MYLLGKVFYGRKILTTLPKNLTGMSENLPFTRYKKTNKMVKFIFELWSLLLLHEKGIDKIDTFVNCHGRPNEMRCAFYMQAMLFKAIFFF